MKKHVNSGKTWKIFKKIAEHAGLSRGKEGACPETGQTANGCGGAVNALAEIFLSDADPGAAANALAEIRTSLHYASHHLLIS